MLRYKTILKPFARNLRSNLTNAEQILWSRLRRKQLFGLQFYRQKPMAGYIADCYCAACSLVILITTHPKPTFNNLSGMGGVRRAT